MGHYTVVATFGGRAALAAARALFFCKGRSPSDPQGLSLPSAGEFFGCRRVYMLLLGDLAETSDRPERAAHPPAFALSGPYIRYLLAFRQPAPAGIHARMEPRSASCLTLPAKLA